MLTDCPGGVFRTLSFRAHRIGDIAQAALAGLGPVLFRFAGDREARYFCGQAASEVGVITATDWDDTETRPARPRSCVLALSAPTRDQRWRLYG
jgi:hypothetical protein